jgi:hypothetical protein
MRLSTRTSREYPPKPVPNEPRDNVVDAVPSCLFPLRTPEAKSEYNNLARVLSQAGRLTVDSYRVLSEYALQFDCLQVSLIQELSIRPSRFDQLRRARKALKLRDLEAPPAAAGPLFNKFALAGFANRPG